MPLTRRAQSALAAVLAGGLLLAGCSSDAGAPAGGVSTTTTAAGPDAAAVVKTYAVLVERSYAASVVSAGKLKEAIAAFTAQPSAATLDAARKQWLAAREDYGPTEAFRFYDGPIDEPDNGPEGQINAWPLDEAYIDYVTGAEPKGIVNDAAAFPEITTEVITEANEKDGETNISTGWHAIEFLLWGQDGNEAGPGNRPVTDFTTAPGAARRVTYLRLLGDLLVADLEGVAGQWAPGTAGNYRATFEADPDAALGKIVRGIGALTAGELAGERLNVAFETRDQEDEHSCFSDNTNADVAANARGVQRVYLAELPGVDGPSLSDLVRAKDPELDRKLTAKLDETVKKATSFPVSFDRMITAEDGTPGRTALKEAITALEEQGELIAAAAKALGVDVNFEI